MFGSLLNEKAVGGVCGALLTNIAGWLSGVFIPIDLIGGAFKTIRLLPFYHSTEAIRISLSGNFSHMLPHLIVVIGYTAIIFTLAIISFNRKMNGEKA
ncbi:ABC-2 type transport system permease protein [Treponema putidum]|nr:ABC-2 type transport system permease protein [Treponema putidum]